MPLSARARLELWNRRLHFYLGLVFLLFLWLFSLTGLLLNHGTWRIAQAANQRHETRFEQSVRQPVGATALARAQDVMQQLHLVGEIDWPSEPPVPGRLDFASAARATPARSTWT